MSNRSAERTQFLTDLFTTAFEGGIGYWAEVEKYKIWIDPKNTDLGTRPDPVGVVVDKEDAWDEDENDPAERHEVTLDTIARGINLIASGEVKFYNMGYRDVHEEGEPHFRIRRLNKSNGEDDDLGDYDALDADAILQAGLFGEIVYG